MGSAARHPHTHAFEQGAGQLNVTGAWRLLDHYEPRASFLPSRLDLTDCPYMWPFCTQPLYHGGMPTLANLTLLNGLAVAGRITSAVWRPADAVAAEVLEVRCEYEEVIWPWAGYFAVVIDVTAQGADLTRVLHGTVDVTVEVDNDPSLARSAGLGPTTSQKLELPVAVRVVPTPPRQKRILWDQFHSIQYPSGYFPRDNLKTQSDMLDWLGDHPHTNYRQAYEALRKAGYFVDVLQTDLTCFDAEDYGALLIIDSEEEFFREEIEKLEIDVREKGLSLIVLADWYSEPALKSVRFFDDNTRSWWEAATGGANVPALNDLLAPYGISFSQRIYDGTWSLAQRESTPFLSGVSIATFPANGYLIGAPSLKERMFNKAGGNQQALRGGGGADGPIQGPARILGGVDICDTPTGCGGGGTAHGRVVVYGDSSCLDEWSAASPVCSKLLEAMASYALTGHRNKDYFPDRTRHAAPYDLADPRGAPLRRPENELYKYSNVVGKTAGAHCGWQHRRTRRM